MLSKNREQQIDTPSRKGFDAIFNSRFIEDITDALTHWGCSRVILVASKGLASNSNYVSSLQNALGHRLVHTKLGVGSHSPYADVRDIALLIQRHQVDCVISVGSCSYSDACKIAGTLAVNLSHDFTIDDMEAMVDKERGVADTNKDGKPLTRRTCKLIAVPTSLSASEWNAVSSATNSHGKKQHFGTWDEGMPDLILLDPEVASTSPAQLWLSSGVRCVDHCVESMCNPKSAEEGKEGVHVHSERGLRCMIIGLTAYKRAKANGDAQTHDRDLLFQGVSDAQYGSREALTGLIIWRVPMGPSHAIGHQLGSVAGVMHGITSCILLPPVLRWQATNLKDPHYKATQAKILAIFNETMGWREASAADAVERFVKSLGLPTTLREVGVVRDEQVQKVAELAMTDIWGGEKRQMEIGDLMEVLNSARG